MSFFGGTVEVGQVVFAIGNTNGEGICQLSGHITATNRKVLGHSCFMFDALVSNGNSGGPVLNEQGLVIGVTTAGNKAVTGMNYALKTDSIFKFIRGFVEVND